MANPPMTDTDIAEVVSAAVASERERCAKIAEDWILVWGDKNPEHVSAQKWATDAMRDVIDGIREETIGQETDR